MKKENKLTTEIVLYGLIFLAALALRLIRLGEVPLLESEASWAFQAWQLAQKESIPISSQVGYLAMTEGLFSLFKATNFLARFWPAVAGSFLVWMPFFFKKELNRIPALLLAGGLALDPSLVPVSRLAGSPMPSLVFLALAVGTFHAKKIPWVLFFLGMALFSGPGLWMGLFILAGFLVFSRWLGLFQAGEYFKDRLDYFNREAESWLVECAPALLGLILIGSFFLSNSQGLSAWTGSLPEFILSWGNPSGLGTGTFLVFLSLNNPLVILFGGLGFIFAWRTDDLRGKALSIWFAVSLLVLLIYPHRQAVDLIWLVIPLWVGAATEFVRLSRLAPATWVIWAMAGLVVVLASLNWLTFTGMIFQVANQTAFLLELGLLAASLALLILAAAVVSSGWGWNASWRGLAGGAAAALLIYMIGSLSLDAYIMEKDPRSIFSGGTGSGQMDLLVDSIADASITATGRPESIQGGVIDGSDALKWALRDYDHFDHLIGITSGIEYPVLITPGEGDFQEIQDNYRGQDFVLNTRPNWGRSLPDDWISWIAFRKGPVIPEYMILWVRNDVYSGY